MGRKKKCTSSTPKTPEEYTDKITGYVEQRQKNKPVKINQYYLQKALKKISNHGVKVKRLHPMIKKYGGGGLRSLKMCSSSSLQAVCPNLLQPVILMPTNAILISTLRKALLSQKWNYCLRLYDIFLKFGGLRSRQLLYLLRLSFLILFNVEVSNEKLDHFLSFTLSIRDTNEKIAFLRSLVELKKFSIERRRGSYKKTNFKNVSSENSEGSEDDERSEDDEESEDDVKDKSLFTSLNYPTK